MCGRCSTVQGFGFQDDYNYVTTLITRPNSVKI